MDFPYVYDDEDNAPLPEGFISHNPTVYPDRYTMKAWENGEPEPKNQKVENGCWNCRNYDWNFEACTINWNNLDPCFYNPDLDDRDPTDSCEEFDLDPDVKPEDFFGGDEP